jgi:hypothetical protein
LTQPQTLQVEQEELWARAEELEQPIEGLPSENPQPPCALAFAIAATTTLGSSADVIRAYLDRGRIEREGLAQSLRNAALAYEDVDDDTAHALNTGNYSASPATPGGLMDEVPEPPTPIDTPIVAADEGLNFTGLQQAAWQIEQPDQGASLIRFADEWTTYQRALHDAAYRFRPFVSWRGPAADAVEADFQGQASWLREMADMCGSMAEQARDVASAHRWAFPYPGNRRTTNHPTSYDVDVCRQEWAKWYKHPQLKAMVMANYDRFVKTSEEVRTEYAKKTSSVSQARPKLPPIAAKIDPPADSDPDTNPNPNPDDGLGLDGNLPDPSGMPSVPSANKPAMPDEAALTDALADVPGLATGGLKPASFGGAGGGTPSTPLQPPVDAESASRPAQPARPVGLPGVTPAATGGGGMGMAPMGAPGAQGQGANKGKRTQQQDKSLYTEKRRWTEPVVGRRRPKDAPDLDAPGV